MLAAVKVATGTCCLPTMSFCRQDFGTVAQLVCAEYKGRVDTLDS